MSRSYAAMKDPRAYVANGGGAVWPLVAGGAGDATAVYSAVSDKRSVAYNVESAMLAINGRAVLAQAATLTLAVALQHTADEDFDTAENIETIDLGSTVLTGGTGGSTELLQRLEQIDVASLLPRWRVRFTPDLSAANTDTAQISFNLLLCGKSEL